MRSLFRKMHKGQRGFTLVELLVVFTLLCVLAAIVSVREEQPDSNITTANPNKVGTK